MLSQEALEQRRCLLALLQRRHERQAYVPFAVLAQIGAGRNHDATLEQTPRESLRRLAFWHRDPEEEGRLASGDAQPGPIERLEHDRSLTAVALTVALDVGLVAPGLDRRELDELLRGRAQRGAEQAKSADHLTAGRDEARAVSGHRGAFAERVEDNDVTPIRHLQRGGRALFEVDLGIGLVRAKQEAVLDRERRQVLVQGKRSNGPGGVVGVVDPNESCPLPHLLADRVEVGEEAVRLLERQVYDLTTGEASSALRYRVGRIGDQHQVLGRT